MEQKQRAEELLAQLGRKEDELQAALLRWVSPGAAPPSPPRHSMGGTSSVRAPRTVIELLLHTSCGAHLKHVDHTACEAFQDTLSCGYSSITDGIRNKT